MQSSQLICNEAISDYEDLFLDNRAGHLIKYSYIANSDHFDLLVNKNKDYYVPHLESQILSSNITSIAKLLGKHVNLYDIGPGPNFSIETKILPLIYGLMNPMSYNAIDTQIQYAYCASYVVKRSFPNLTTSAKQIDCSYPYTLDTCGKACVLFLGNTVGNLNSDSINITLTNFYNAIKVGDFVIVTADCTQDTSLLEKAYSGHWTHSKFTLATMQYCSNTLAMQGFRAEDFGFEHTWSGADRAVHQNVVALESQTFAFNDKIIHIPKGKKYHVITSRKFTPEWIDERVMSHGFKIRGRFSDPDKRVFLYVLQK